MSLLEQLTPWGEQTVVGRRQGGVQGTRPVLGRKKKWQEQDRFCYRDSRSPGHPDLCLVHGCRSCKSLRGQRGQCRYCAQGCNDACENYRPRTKTQPPKTRKHQCIHFQDEETGTQRGKIMCPKSQLLLQLKIANQDSGFPAQGSYFFAIDLLVSRKICVRAPRKLCHNYHSYHSVLVRLWIDPVMGWGFGGTQDGVNIFCTWDRHEFFRPKADCGRMNNGRSKMFISQFPEPVNMLPYMAEQCCKCN